MNKHGATLVIVAGCAVLCGCAPDERTIEYQNQTLELAKESLEIQREALAFQQQTRDELKALDARLAALESVGALENAADEAFEARVEYLTSITAERYRANVDIEALARVEEPEDQSPANVKKYVAQILVVSDSQRSSNSQDTQVRMLVELGPEQLPLLLNELRTRDSGNARYHLRYAVTKLANEETKAAIIAAFANDPESSELLSVVTSKKWYADAKEPLLAAARAMLKSSSSYANSTVTRALGELDDPEATELLIQLFIHKSNRSYAYGILSKMADVELDDATREAWHFVMKSENGSSDRAYVAALAVPLGEKTALAELITQLGAPKRSSNSPDPRMLALAHLDFSGTNEEIKAWFFANQGNIRFNEKTKKYEVAAN